VFDGRDVERSAEGTIPIDLFVTTHIDQDHVGGIESLRENNYKIQNVVEPANRRFETYTPGVDTPKGRVSEFTMGMYENGLEKHDIDTVSQMSTGDTLPTDLNIDTQVLSPPSKEEEPTREDEEIEFSRREDGYNVTFGSSRANENGVVFKIEDEHSALFMGDVQNKTNHHAESWLIEQHDDPESEVNADVLFVGHHGSDNATSQEFLERVDPSTVVISSDLGEQFDHPRDKILKNLHEHDVDVYWTAGHGTIRNDLNEGHATEQTTGLETTDAADLAALKHYCKENETDAEDVKILAADELSEDTPDWVAEAAPMVAETTQEMVDTAITNADTVAEVRQTLDDHPAAAEHLREIVQTDRDEYVTTQTDVRENRQAYRDAQQAQAAAQPSKSERLRGALPLVSDQTYRNTTAWPPKRSRDRSPRTPSPPPSKTVRPPRQSATIRGTNRRPTIWWPPRSRRTQPSRQPRTPRNSARACAETSARTRTLRKRWKHRTHICLPAW
jgi:hypothetical protein